MWGRGTTWVSSEPGNIRITIEELLSSKMNRALGLFSLTASLESEWRAFNEHSLCWHPVWVQQAQTPGSSQWGPKWCLGQSQLWGMLRGCYQSTASSRLGDKSGPMGRMHAVLVFLENVLFLNISLFSFSPWVWFTIATVQLTPETSKVSVPILNISKYWVIKPQGHKTWSLKSGEYLTH